MGVLVHKSPVVYRYIDWSITVPLQMIEFNLILKAAGRPTTSAGFWKLLIGTIIMLAAGYLGETFVIKAWVGFGVGIAGWLFILFEIFFWEGRLSGECSKSVRDSLNNMRFIVTVGWSIYPLGYLEGELLANVDQTALNVIYNVADLVNKIMFVCACWKCAKEETLSKRGN